MNTADGLVCELAEGRRGEVEVELGAAYTTVGDRDRDGLALVCAITEIMLVS